MTSNWNYKGEESEAYTFGALHLGSMKPVNRTVITRLVLTKTCLMRKLRLLAKCNGTHSLFSIYVLVLFLWSCKRSNQAERDCWHAQSVIEKDRTNSIHRSLFRPSPPYSFMPKKTSAALDREFRGIRDAAFSPKKTREADVYSYFGRNEDSLAS